MPGVTVGKRRPGGGVDWQPPLGGQYPVRHVDTFINRYTSLSNVYRDYDEALLDNRDNAKSMRNDLSIRECLDSRQRSVALLNWHLEPEDEKSHDQREFCSTLERIVREISHFYEYRRNAQHAIWYGKYGIQHRWGIKVIQGKSYYLPAGRHQDDWGWRPLHGDKVVFRQLRADAEMPAGSYEGQMGIRVGYRYEPGQVINNRWKVEPTDYGLAYFLSPAERRLMLVHKHHVEDASFDDGLRAGSIYGVGIRSVVYWEWVQKQETLAFLMEFMGRMAGGIQVWKYPTGNPQAKAEVQTAAENYNSEQEHVVLVPVPAGDVGQYGVEVIDPGFSGVEQLQSMLTGYFCHNIKRYILGQTLTSEADATGMGSGVADLHLDTLLQILKSDATNLEETLRSDLIASLIQVNVSKGVFTNPGFRPKFVIETEEDDVDKKLEAWLQASDRGLPIKKSDMYELIGAAMPGLGDDVFVSQGQQDPALPSSGANEHPPEQTHADPTGEAPPREPDETMPKKPSDNPARYSRPRFPRSSNGFKRSTLARMYGLK